MKMLKNLSVAILGLLFTSGLIANSSAELDWTKDNHSGVIPKISKDTGKPVKLGNGGVAFVLGNGAVGFFPEASADELSTMGNEVGASFTVYDRFRVISTLVAELDLNENQYLGSQKVPTAELVELAQLVVTDDLDVNGARAILAELAEEHAGNIQYRFKKN